MLDRRRVREWGSFSATLVRAGAGRHIGELLPDHRLLFYATEGVGTACACEGLSKRRVLRRGEFDVVPAGASGVWEDEAPVDLLKVRLPHRLVCATAADLGLPDAARELAAALGARDPLIEPVASALATELGAASPGGRLYAESLGVALTVRLLQNFVDPARRVPSLSRRQTERVLDYVEAHLDADLSLAELAAVAGVSVPHLTPLFRRAVGQSAHRYVMERRVQRARDLLLSSRASVASIAAETGFAHQSHLARWMRRLLGVTPRMLRESL